MDFSSEKSTKVVDGESPSHKITIKDLAQKMLTFWYVKSNEALPDFNKMKHKELVNLMHAESTGLQPSDFVSFPCEGNHYHLKHIGEGEYIIKVLK
jgi:hypothetical protein